jgi:hypothetical protein
MNDKKKKAISYLILGLMILSSTATAASITTFSDGGTSVEVELRVPGDYQDGLTGGISLLEGETITSATVNVSTGFAMYDGYTKYDQSIMPQGGGGIWDARYNSGLTTYSDANCHVASPLDCSFTSTSESLSLTSKGFNADFEIGGQGMAPGAPIDTFNWERKSPGMSNIPPSGCSSGSYCWGTNFDDPDYTDDTIQTDFEYTVDTKPIWVFPTKGTATFKSYHSTYYRQATGNNFFYEDCAYVAVQNSSDGNGWSQWGFMPLDLGTTQGLQQGTQGLFQVADVTGVTTNKVQTSCNGKGPITVPANEWVLAGKSTWANNANGWATIGLDLTAHEGKYVKLKFVLEKNPMQGVPVNNTMPGWYIDALRIGDALPQSGNVVLKSFSPRQPPNPGFPDGYGILDVEVATAGPGSFTVDVLDSSNGQLVVDRYGRTMASLEGELIELWDIDADQYGLIDLRFNYNSGASRMSSPEMHGFTIGTKVGSGLNSSDSIFFAGGTLNNGQWDSDPVQGGMIIYMPKMNDTSWTPLIEKNRFSMPIMAAKPMISDSCGGSNRNLVMMMNSNQSGQFSPVNNQWITFSSPSTGIGFGAQYSAQCTVYSMWIELRFAHTMSDVRLDIAGDGDVEWGMTESAYGSLGRQQMFRTHMANGINYGSDNITLAMNIAGIAEGGVFFLPKGAQVSHAELSWDNANIGNSSIELLAGPSSQMLGYTNDQGRETPDAFGALSEFYSEVQALLDDPNVPMSHADEYGNEWIQFRFKLSNPTAQAATSINLRDLDIFYSWTRVLSDDNNFARELNQGVALGQPIGGQVVVPMKFTSTSGGGVVLDNLLINTANGYDSTLNMTGDSEGLYASGEVYEVISTHAVGASTGATIAGASLQFESESGITEFRWASNNDSFWIESGSERVSIMVALSSSSDTADGKQILWRFRVNSVWEDSASVRMFATLITDGGSEGLPAALYFNPAQGNAVENDASISELIVYNQANAEQTDLLNIHSNNILNLEGKVRFEDLEVAPDPASYSLIFELQNDSNLSQWDIIDSIPGILGGNFSWQPSIPELSAGNDTYRIRMVNYTGGDTNCPPASLSPDAECGVPMTVYIDQYSPYLVNISVWDGIQNWRDLQDDTWIPPKANQKFRVVVRDIPETPPEFVLNYWVEAQHDTNGDRIPDLSEYHSVPLLEDSTDANGNTTYVISNSGCQPTNDCIDDRQTGLSIPTGDPAPRTSLFVSGTDISGNSVDGGEGGFILDLITYIGKESRPPGIYSFHVSDSDGNPLTEFNKSMYAGNVYHLLVDGKDENGWRDVEYVKVDLNPAITDDLVVYFSPRNGTAWTSSTSATLLNAESDGVGARAVRLDGTALIDPFETEFMVDIPIRLEWGVTNLQGVITPEVFMKDLDPENGESKLSSSRYIQRWAYSSGLKFDLQSLSIADTSGFITTSVGGLDGGFVRPGDLLQLQGDYLFKSALESGIFVQPEIAMTLELTRIPVYPGGESDKPGSGYVAAATDIFYYPFENGSFDIVMPAALSTNEYRYVFRICSSNDVSNPDCDNTLPAGASDFSIADDRTFYVKVDNEAPTVVWGSWTLTGGSGGEEYTSILPSSTIHCVSMDFAIEERQKLELGSMQINWMFYQHDLNWSQYKSTYPDAWMTADLSLDVSASPNRASGNCIDLWPDHDLPSDLDGVDLRFWVSGTDSAGNGITLAGQFGSAVEGGEYSLTYQEAEFSIERVTVSPSQPEAGQSFELLIDVTNTGTHEGELNMQIFIVIEGRQSGNFNHSCGKVLAAGTNEMCIVKVDAFPEPVTAVKFKIHDEDGNELGESSSFSIKAAGSSDTGGANWALYGGIFGGVLVLIALVVGLLMFMGREGDEGDDFFVEDEDYLPPGQAVQPISRGPARAESTDSGDYGGRSSGPPGYSAGPPGGSESKMDRAKRLFPFWDDATIQNYFDQGWSIQQLQDWVKENK